MRGWIVLVSLALILSCSDGGQREDERSNPEQQAPSVTHRDQAGRSAQRSSDSGTAETGGCRAQLLPDRSNAPDYFESRYFGSFPDLRSLEKQFVEASSGPIDRLEASRRENIQSFLDTLGSGLSTYPGEATAYPIDTIRGVGVVTVLTYPSAKPRLSATQGRTIPWIFVQQRERDDLINWVGIGRERSGRFSEVSIRIRRISKINEWERSIWIETQEESVQAGTRPNPDTLTTRWVGYVVRMEGNETLRPQAYRIPIRLERRTRGASSTQNLGTGQIDVSFPEPGVMAVTARTDSVSDEQRCWLGRHVIDTTATDERPRR